MKTIKENVNNEIIIKNSRFITYLIKLNDNNINNLLDELKTKYPKANHYCYAYIYNNEKHSSDDKEPSNTAGLPMLNVLEKEELNNLLAVTIRYFGGIKLGAGGLVRAYTKSITETLKESTLIELEEGYKLELIFNYNQEKQINYILKESTILNKEFDNEIKYIVLVNNNTLDNLKEYNYKIIDNILIEKR